MTEKLYTKIASAIEARKNCELKGNTEWFNNWTDKLAEYEKMLPSGSGIDSGCKIDLDHSTCNKIVILFGFHHMDDNGYYCGWTDYKAIVTPSLISQFNLKIYFKDI